MSTRTGPSSILGDGEIAEIELRLPPVLGCERGLALPSATMALRVAMQSLGVRPGDEVIVPALDWIASVAAARSLGARPVPVDILLPDCTISPPAVAGAITDRTRAVVVTHLNGIPADVAAIASICRQRAIVLIEDAAQALGALLDGSPVGSFGDAAAISFGPGKLIDVGGGGMLVTRTTDVWREAVRNSQHPARQLRAGIHPPNLAVLEARIHPGAAVGVAAALDHLEARIAVRHALAQELQCEASEHRLTPPTVGDRAHSVATSLPVAGVSIGLALGRLRRLSSQGLVDIGAVVGWDLDELPNARLALRDLSVLRPVANQKLVPRGDPSHDRSPHVHRAGPAHRRLSRAARRRTYL